MRFSDYITNAELYVFPTIGLIAFISVFAVVTWRAFRTSKAVHQRHASLPLDLPTPGSEPARSEILAGDQS